MVSDLSPVRSAAIFCKVVDNYGDIGICWRLARQLTEEHGLAVALWVDDLVSFGRIRPEISPDQAEQCFAGVAVRHWRDQDDEFSAGDIADLVIEFFGCDIPPGYIAAMAQREPRPVWINLEGLTAEEWVEGCHTLPSPHPRLPLTKHFFFPGFTGRTGGLLHERSLEDARRRFQADREDMAAFLARFGVRRDELASMKVSLFCYPHAPVSALFEAWEREGAPVTCLVPEDVAAEAVQAFLGREGKPGATGTRGALTVRILPFVPQPDYDKLLWACDMNFVRGEDSFVRAQWAGRPFVWHIYPQDENLHHKKLRAFLERYATGLEGLTGMSLRWNGVMPITEPSGLRTAWQQLQSEMPKIERRAEEWRQQMLANGDLIANLLTFAATLRSAGPEKKV